MKTFAISIPKPCHEDWNKMTPDAKGAFCGSCKKSVYDFSKKTDEEIIEVFEKEEKGKVCGRFTPAQLTRPVVSFGNPTITSRLAIFAYALLMVFGAALFTGADAYGQEMMKGEVDVKEMPLGKVAVIEKVVEPVTATKEVTKGITKSAILSVKQTKTTKCGLNKIENVELMSLGQMVVIETVIETPPPTIYGNTTVVEEPQMLTGDTIFEVVQEPMGAVVVEPVTIGIDTVATEEVIVDSKIVETVPLIEPEEMLMIAGGVSYVEIIESEVIEPIVTPIDSVVEETVITETVIVPEEESTEDKTPIVSETIITPPMQLEVKVSPNPSCGQITLSYNLENTMPVRIDLFDITGKIVKTLSNQGKQYAGKYNVSYNISDLPNGIYMATLSTDENKVSAKIILTK